MLCLLRKTTKYWVRAEDVPRLHAAIIRHLPLLVVGRTEGALLEHLAHPHGPDADAKPTSTLQVRVALQQALMLLCC
jgi:SPX domain protein involved in polyphosphate accumulation